MVEIIVQKENKLLKREELVTRVEHAKKATPNRKELEHALAEGIKVSADRLIIERVVTKPGTHESQVHVYVYKSADAVPKQQRAVHDRRREGKKAAAEAK